MFYYLLYSLHDTFSALNVFRYITFRSALAAVTSFLISIILGPIIIKKLTQLKIGQHVRKEESLALYDLHRHKQGTPTMGGVLILASILVSVFLWSDLYNSYVVITILTCIWLGIVGFFDDYLKLTQKKSKGLNATMKLFWQFLLGIFIGLYIYLDPNITTTLDFPFFKKIVIDLGIFYILFVILIIVGSSNAVNLTDGLDGLAIGCVLMVSFALAILSYVSGHVQISRYLLIPYISGVGELTVFCAAIFGASLGFLWFNCFPATVFMGDVGSLSLGGTLGIIAVFIKKELLLGILGGIFVIEALSVILQVASFKLKKKRIFKMTPIHHHFQMMGWPESKIIIRFWIIGIILAILTIMTLKLR
ncbi:MAG: phospho-N-acetylmuramoyl-pentapeptide-transferase [Candidatus Omnitrophota bacterium]|nr:phospho-N-acetylmuramoyl-pentapeptide-transferase [Candidatus Omnitrophota bacterium]